MGANSDCTQRLDSEFSFFQQPNGKDFSPIRSVCFRLSLNQKQVDMFRTVSFFTHMQWHKATLITKAYDAHTDRGILSLEFWYVFDGQGKGETYKVKRVFIVHILG